MHLTDSWIVNIDTDAALGFTLLLIRTGKFLGRNAVLKKCHFKCQTSIWNFARSSSNVARHFYKLHFKKGPVVYMWVSDSLSWHKLPVKVTPFLVGKVLLFLLHTTALLLFSKTFVLCWTGLWYLKKWRAAFCMCLSAWKIVINPQCRSGGDTHSWAHEQDSK